MRSLFHLFPSALSDDELQIIETAAQAVTEQDGIVFSTAENSQTLRRSKIKWLKDEAIRQLLWRYVDEANQASFDVDVTNQADMQYTIYDSAQSDHYDWHHDVHWSSQDERDRKLSVTVQLSDPQSYQGGTFEFDEVKTTANFSEKGSVLVFPSYLSHKVHAVTAGQRRSLVAWFFGPRWR